MRGATHCARRLKALYTSLRSRLGKVSLPAGGEPITQMILGILTRDMPEAKAREALERIRGLVVDYNELRVIPPIELAELVGDYPDVRLKCEDISRALNRIFALHHHVGLDHLSSLGPKEVQNYLEKLDGLEPYTRARVRLLGLRQHAVPLDEAMWAYARQEQIVDPRCPLAEAQAFLERQLAPEDALEFFALLRRQAWNELGAAVRKREVEHIASTPPDRTARNMLQLVGAAAHEEPADVEAELLDSDAAAAEAGNGEPPEPAAAPAARRPAHPPARRPPGSARKSGSKHALPKASKAAPLASQSVKRKKAAGKRAS